MYSDLFHVDIDFQPNLGDDNFIKQYDFIHYHRTLGDYEKLEQLLERIEKLGVTTIMDIDDYWDPGPHHPSYSLIKGKGIDKLILNNIKSARNVLTTTPIFAEEIRKHNKNVFVIENAIDPNEKQFQPTPEPSQRIRIGWLGGSCLTPETQILTEQGWKFFTDLEKGIKVATLNPNTNVVEYHEPMNYIQQQHNGLIHIFENDKVSFSVTGNHNMFVSIDGGEYKLITCDELLKTPGDTFSVRISEDGNETMVINKSDITSKQYEGLVYCVEVENHVIYVRRNNKSLWVGNSHYHDLALLEGLVSKLKGDNLLDKVQFVLCGFDTRGTVTMIDQKTGQHTQRAIKPEESVWCRYEEIFTNRYNSVSPKYKEYLLKYTKDEEFDTTNEPYRRVWTKPISSYASNYNLFDISLAPLQENTFNKVKSQLKVVEAGFHKKAIIAQDFGPYKIDIQHAWESGEGIGEGNGLLVDSHRNHKDWYKYIKHLVNHPEKIKQLGDSLYETVTKKFHIDVVTEKRKDLYIQLINQKNKVENLVTN